MVVLHPDYFVAFIFYNGIIGCPACISDHNKIASSWVVGYVCVNDKLFNGMGVRGMRDGEGGGMRDGEGGG